MPGATVDANVALEVTGSATDNEGNPLDVANMNRLRELGVGISVDDFGTGYSSLAYLCRLPIHGLKIDRSFVGHLTDTIENLEVVRAITRLADTLGLTVVAEGVETEAQWESLRALPCHHAQGFLFGRPARITELTRQFEEAASGA